MSTEAILLSQINAELADFTINPYATPTHSLLLDLDLPLDLARIRTLLNAHLIETRVDPCTSLKNITLTPRIFSIFDIKTRKDSFYLRLGVS